MLGSRSEIPFILLHNYLDGEAAWVIHSLATRIIDAQLPWEVIQEDAPNYLAVLKVAGPKPVLFHQEVTTRSNNEKANSTNNVNPHDVALRK